MELYLNILWVLMALAALGACCISGTHHKRLTPRRPQAWIALICALVFLFFAVSLSDDLHSASALCDDSAPGRHRSLIWDCAHSLHQNAERPRVSSAAAPSRLLFSVNLQIAERILPATIHVDCGLQRRSLSGRSPPLLPTSEAID
jgi:hypothetical protein